jgi:putative oxidoreductase
MQRLFGMFPTGWPGTGLLLLRIVGGGFLIRDGIAGLSTVPLTGSVMHHVVAVGTGALLLMGLWTPFAGVVAAIHELWNAYSAIGDLRSAVLSAAVGSALAMLGPGFYAVDGLFFGRKRLDIRAP